MSHEFMNMMENVLEGGVVFGSVGPTVGIIAYVFSSLALYTIAQRRGISKAWLVWIPVVNLWILGSLSDQYRYVVKGQIKSKRKVLLVLSVLSAILSCAAFIKLIVSMVMTISGMAQGMSEFEMIRPLLSGLAFYIPVVIVGIAGFVFETMALYDVYTSCDPANNVLYLILSIIPGISQVTRPLFLFLCRNQDGGMPPRKPNPIPNTRFDEPLDYEYEEVNSTDF